MCKGWKSLPGRFDLSRLNRVGTPRDADETERTLEEYHMPGTGA